MSDRSAASRPNRSKRQVTRIPSGKFKAVPEPRPTSFGPCKPRASRPGSSRTNSHVTMNYRLLGPSGLRISELCLGTMTFGEDWGWGASKDEAHKIYDAFREAGGNFIDTANVYTQGTSETFLGEFFSGHRDSVVLATKYTNALTTN